MDSEKLPWIYTSSIPPGLQQNVSGKKDKGTNEAAAALLQEKRKGADCDHCDIIPRLLQHPLPKASLPS